MDFEIRKDRGSTGRRPLTRERAAYFALMSQGYSSAQACDLVGVNRRTGKVWRNGHHAPGKGKTPKPPIYQPAVASGGPSRYLQEADRVHIADSLHTGASIRTIARELGRAPSTISREVRRNRHPTNHQYRPYAAQARAHARRPRPKPRKISHNPQLWDFIADRLTLRWSPAQICQALRRRFADQPEMHVAHETIYQAIYVQGRGQLRRDLAQALRRGRAVRKPRGLQRGSRLKDMVLISDRPAEVADRAVPGHWEGDLLIGAGNRSAIGTLVERATRYVLLVHLPHGYGAEHTRDALATTITTLPRHLCRSLTWDQGREMAAHHAFSVATNIPVYFCDPGKPWQRGSNENTNGLLRQYFPKGTDLSRHTRQDLQAVAAELNARPRKTLGWDTPAQRLALLLATRT
jgi:transposase, IS30 family